MSLTAPTVYFIDDSATMREVIKIAFRRENINVIACHDAVTALAEIEKNKPDIVISDVIMPDKDGYEVCQYIKGNPELAKVPVVLMSGVVNRAVAERAFAVKADELLRKPFQPQDLIARVRHLLKPNGAPTPTQTAAASAAMALSSIFSSAAPAAPKPAASPASRPVGSNGHSTPQVVVAAVPAPSISSAPAYTPVAAPSVATSTQAPAAPSAVTSAAKPAVAQPDQGKLRIEVLRLEGLVKKLQSELLAEREYSKALEAHIKTLQEAE